MDPQVSAALVGGGAGLATGVVGSLLAPWSNWGVEKRRGRLERRRQLIDEWREESALAEKHGGLSKDDEWYRTLVAQRRPPRLGNLRRWARTHIPKKWRKAPPPVLPGGPTVDVISMPDGRIRVGEHMDIEIEISRLARKWGID